MIKNNRTPAKNPPINKFQLIKQSTLNKNGIPSIELFLRGEDDDDE
ncbi:MAG: hypothetical protein HRU07_06670 [Nitrosopumilus sp.]|nr:hypothetical protein [Nitrosopumilus sp.]NRA05824.1 hypothetical protein [Nitrosopumilus sp.]